MNPLIVNGLKEVAKEIALQPAIEVGKKAMTNAFENSLGKVGEEKEPTHIETINENLKDKEHPKTGVKYESKVFKNNNGEKVEGVFPKFESRFDTILPKELQEASDQQQFKYCIEQLGKRIEVDSKLKKQFSNKQIEQIKNGAPKISGLTWHHNEEPGKMQLVDAKTHSKTAHTGGRCIWGGGSDCR